MKVKCDYCGGFINDYDEKCPNCGAVNSHLVRNANEAPKTIEELKQWYIDMKLPDENTTRFFIGKNYQEPKAFGIYKDDNTGNFVVYKNKADGVRAVRYEGKDENYAVNELYMKLKEEIMNQKARNNNMRNQNTSVGKQKNTGLKWLFIFMAIILVVVIIAIIFDTPNGYYNYDNKHYYHQAGDWFLYGDYGWTPTTAPSELEDHASDYYDSSAYNSNSGVSDFKDSGYYKESTTDDGWDTDSTWDSGDTWDSGGTDWSSDW